MINVKLIVRKINITDSTFVVKELVLDNSVIYSEVYTKDHEKDMLKAIVKAADNNKPFVKKINIQK